MAENKVSIIIGAVDKTEDALNSVRSNIGRMGQDVSRLQGIITSFAAVAGVTAFSGMIQGSIESMAALKDLATSTGGTVEGLSALRSVAKLSGIDMGTVAGSLQRLSKNMVSMDDDGKEASRAIAAIGLDVGKLKAMKPDEAMKAIADALAGFSGGAEKTAVAMALFGREGANALPFMENLAAAGKLNAKVTAEQADQAYEFEKNLTKLSATGQGWQKEIAAGMLPALNDFSSALLGSINGANGLREEMARLAKDGSIKEWATDALNAVTHVIDAFQGVARVAQLAGVAIASAAKYAETVHDISAMGPFSQFTSAGREEAAAKRAELGRFLDAAGEDAKRLLTTPLLGQKVRESFAATTAAKAKALEDYSAATKQVMAAYAGYDTKTQQAAMVALKNAYFGEDKKPLNFVPKGTSSAGGEKRSARDPLDSLLENYRNDAYAESIGLSPSTTKELANLDELIRKGKIDAAEYDDLLATVLGKDSVMKAAEDKRNKSLLTQATLGQAPENLAAKYQQQNAVYGEKQMTKDQRELEAALRKVEEAATAERKTLAQTAASIQGDDVDALNAFRDAIAKVGDMEEAQKEKVIALQAEQERLNSLWETGATRALNKLSDSSKTVADQVEEAFTKGFQGMEDALMTFTTTGKLSFTAMATSMIADLARVELRAQMLKLMPTGSSGGSAIGGLLGKAGDWISSLFGGSGITGGTVAGVMTNGIANMVGTSSANGNVFSSAGLSAYSGSIVSRPTIFPFAHGIGLMGEAGPEAIMPLARDASGKLGIRGGGHSITVNQYFSGAGSTPAEIRRSHAQSARDGWGIVQGASRFV